MKTLYLYGPPGSGKSTLAAELSRFYGRPHLDLDALVEQREHMTIAEIFKTRGEAEFRRIESLCLRRANAPIVALGGGTLLDPANRSYAEKKGFVVVIDTDAKTIAARVKKGGASRPLGDKASERKTHYASFEHHLKPGDRIILPRLLRGNVTPPISKSHLHRLLIARFLAGERGDFLSPCADDCDDIAATRRCLAAIAAHGRTLNCGESGSTLRFLSPICAALGMRNVKFVRKGRLSERPFMRYRELKSGVHSLKGDVSSQFVTGLLFALPLLDGDSEICFETPLQSCGYVDMTVDVLSAFGVRVRATQNGFFVPGNQRYVAPKVLPKVERDWSAAAFWFAAQALGNDVKVVGLNPYSRQPDRCIKAQVRKIFDGRHPVLDVSGCPDLYPALAVVDAGCGYKSQFVGTERLRLKESDRLAAMERLLANPRDVDSCNDHRVAMAAGILATAADCPTLIHGADCVAKSYPGFWDAFHLNLYAVVGWPLEESGSPALHNASFVNRGFNGEMVRQPVRTPEEAMRFAVECGVRGMAVTIPHKRTIIPLLDSLDESARAVGAVNTVCFGEDGTKGYNTDVGGFIAAIREFMRAECLRGMPVALLGNGGAAQACQYALGRLGANVRVFHREQLDGFYPLIVNATPVDPIPEYAFTGKEKVYDLRYVPEITPLMARARKAGCRAANGLSMLQAQAALQQEIWHKS